MDLAGFVDELRCVVPAMGEPVEAAFRAVDRADFVAEGVDPYRTDETVVLVEDAGGVVSSISAPSIVARMLNQADIRPGMKVLEIGTASGFSAALMASMGASVTSIEVVPELVETARQRLESLGIPVQVHLGDGMVGWPQDGPYDRVVFTCSVVDLPGWVWDQTAPDARVVAPVRWGSGACWALDREGDEFVCRDAFGCGFVPLVGQDPLRVVDVMPGLVLRGAAGEPLGPVSPSVSWLGLQVGSVPVLGLSMRLWGRPGACHVTGRPEGLPMPMVKWNTPALWDGGLVYVAIRRVGDDWEVGVCSLGASRAAVGQLSGYVADWVRDPDGWPPAVVGRR